MNAPQLQWETQRAFLAVLRTGSLSGAARLLGIAQATGAFDPDQPDVPTSDDAEEARLRQIRAARSATGPGATILTPLGIDAEQPTTQSATLLGQAAPREGGA